MPQISIIINGMKWLWLSSEILALGYGTALIGLIIWFRALKGKYPKVQPENLPISVSVVVAFRNESEHLNKLYNSLIAQNASCVNSIELLFINDNSEDDSVEQLNQCIQKYGTPFSVKVLNSENVGKKAAIQYGVEQSSGSIILTTDADCEMGDNWVSKMISPFINEQMGMCLGIVEITGKNFLAHFQSFEMKALQFLTAFTAMSGKPSLANAANMGFRKSMFLELGGHYDHMDMATGDDEMLLKKVNLQSDQKVFYQFSKDAIVKTPYQKTLKSFLHQRIRWASKWKKGNNTWPALVVWLFNWAFLLVFTNILIEEIAIKWSIYAIGLKLLSEYLLMQQISNGKSSVNKVLNFILSSFLYPFYSVFMGIVSNLGTYSWKGRTYKVK